MDENTGSNSYYQDNTANLQYQQPPVEEGPSKANGLQVVSRFAQNVTELRAKRN